MIKWILIFLMVVSIGVYGKAPETTSITKTQLQDKIKGGWVGQVIGCTFGGPTEFKFRGTMIQDYQPIPWDNQRCKWWFDNEPGLYDDVYMDLTFVDVFEKEGLDAPAKSHALAFANADYKLWHANQAARYNILRGIMPPQSGHWLNSPHADDIDFQIEADFAGLMSPGMVNVSSAICDKIGHIMNYGDGWYGGVYVAAMYSLAFTTNDIPFIVEEALKSVPEKSGFHQCIADVIKWHKQYPNDWKQNWFECQKIWTEEVGCPDGVFDGWNIDAKINAAYIVIGLLYGNGDFGKTMEISTRCGQDSDCNPASAGGILGVILGYNKIPDYWKKPAQVVEGIDFPYTTMSLNDVYEIGFGHALKNLKKNGVNTDSETIQLPDSKIIAVQTEVAFEGHFPKVKYDMGKYLDTKNTEFSFEFEGNGFVLSGQSERTSGNGEHSSVIEMYVDGKKLETFEMPTEFRTRRHELGWAYQLKEGKHKVSFKILNPKDGFRIWARDLVVYSSTRQAIAWKK